MWGAETILKSKIAGAIYPVPIKFISRFFDGQKKVFIKCLPRSTTRLEPKKKILLYGSYGSKSIFGEGTIDSVEFLNPSEILIKYRENLFLSEQELFDYVAGRNQRLLTVVLTKLKRYKSPILFHKPITMVGQYITPDEYDSLGVIV